MAAKGADANKFRVKDSGKKKMRQSADVINRIRIEDWLIGFEDRFTGMQEKTFEAFEWGEVSEHRIYYFKFRGKVVWDRRDDGRLDLVFGSQDGCSSIYDLLHLPKVPPPGPTEEELELEARAEQQRRAKEVRRQKKAKPLAVPGGPSASAPPPRPGLDPASEVAHYTSILYAPPVAARPNFFVAWRLVNEELTGRLHEVQHATQAQSHDLPDAALIPPGALHISMAFLRITTTAELQAAACIMKTSIPKLLSKHMATRKASKMKFAGLGMFGSRVLYTSPDERRAAAQQRLFDLQLDIEQEFVSSGLQVTPIARFWDPKNPTPGVSHHNGFAPHVSIVRVTPRTSALGNEAGAADGSGAVKGDVRVPASATRQGMAADGSPVEWGEDFLRGLYLCSMNAPMGADGFYTHVAKVSHPAFEAKAAPPLELPVGALQTPGLKRQASLPDSLPPVTQLLKQASALYAADEISAEERSTLRETIMSDRPPREAVQHLVETLGGRDAKHASALVDDEAASPAPPAAAAGAGGAAGAEEPPLSAELPPLPEAGVPPSTLFPRKADATALEHKLHEMHPSMGATWLVKSAGGTGMLRIEKLLVVLRGIPGAGKSSTTKAISQHVLSQFGPAWRALGGIPEGATGKTGPPMESWADTPPLWVVASADNYFVNAEGEYRFDQSRIGDAHSWCKKLVSKALASGVALVIVDNTATRLFEYGHYLSEASRRSYGSRVAEIACPNEATARIFAARNSHGVPPEKVLEMWRRWEGRPGATVVRPYGVPEATLLPERGSDAWHRSVSLGVIDGSTGWLAPLGAAASAAAVAPGSPKGKPARGKPPASKHLKRAYFAAFLTHASRRQLLAACPPKFRDRMAAEHMTLQFSPPSSMFADMPFGARVQLQLGKVYSNATVQTITVQAAGCSALQQLLSPIAQNADAKGDGWGEHGLSANLVPHITLSIAPDGRAADSNDLLASISESTVADDDLGTIMLDAVLGLAVPPSPTLMASLGREACASDVSDFTVSGAFVITSRASMGLPPLPAHLSRLLPHASDGGDGDDALLDAPDAPKESVSIQSDSGRPFVLADAQSAPPTTLFVFDFDGTLFLTPGRREGKWQYEAVTGSKWERAGWLQHPESLQAPMKVYPGPALPAFRLHKNVAGSRTVVLTARHIATGNAVRAVCQQAGVRPDAFIFNRTGAPGPQYKINAICLQLDELAAQHAAYAMATGHPLQRLQRLVIWEDDPKCIAAYKQVQLSRGAPAAPTGPTFEIFNVAESHNVLRIPRSLNGSEYCEVQQPLSHRTAQAALEQEAEQHSDGMAVALEAAAEASTAHQGEVGQFPQQVQPQDSPLLLHLARQGMLRTNQDTAAAEDALDAMSWTWSQVLRSHFNMPLAAADGSGGGAVAGPGQRPPLLGYVFGSYPLGSAGCDVDMCLLCPDSLPVADAVQQMTSLLQRAKLTSKVYASQTARIPRLAISVPHPDAPDVEMDIVFVPVRGTALASALRKAAHSIEGQLPRLVRIVDGGATADSAEPDAPTGVGRAPLPHPFSTPRDAATLVQGSLHKGHGASITSALFSQAALGQLTGAEVQPTAASSGGDGRGVAGPLSPPESTHAAIAPQHFAATLQWIRQLLHARWMSGSVFSCVRSYHLVLVLSSLVGARARGVNWETLAAGAASEQRRLYASPDALLVDFLQQAVLMGHAGWSMVAGDRVPSQAVQALVQLWRDTAVWIGIAPAVGSVGLEEAALYMAKQCGVPTGKSLTSVAITTPLSLGDHMAATVGFCSPNTTLLHELESAVPPLPSPGQVLVVLVCSCDSPRLAWQLQHIIKARLATALRTIAHKGFHITPGLEDVSLSMLLATLSVSSLVGPVLNSAGEPMRVGEPHSLDDARVTGHTHTTALMARDALFRLGLECSCLCFSVRRSRLGIQAVKSALADLNAWIAPVQAVAEQDGAGSVKVRVRLV